jgi:hypothetical protein
MTTEARMDKPSPAYEASLVAEAFKRETRMETTG